MGKRSRWFPTQRRRNLGRDELDSFQRLFLRRQSRLDLANEIGDGVDQWLA
jgi:hypothetical protein